VADPTPSAAALNARGSDRRAAREAGRMGALVVEAEAARETAPTPASLELGDPGGMGALVVEAEAARLDAAPVTGPLEQAVQAAEAEAPEPEPEPAKKAPAKKAATTKKAAAKKAAPSKES
jgi:hypothetical protein